MRKVIFALCLFFSAGAGAEPLETRGFASLTLTDVPKYEVGVGASFRGDHLDVHGLAVVGRDGDFHSAGLRYLYAERQEALGDSGTSAVGVRVGRVRHWLDQLAAEIRLNTKCAVSRAEILRAMVAAVEASGISLAKTHSAEEITAILQAKLQA